MTRNGFVAKRDATAVVHSQTLSRCHLVGNMIAGEGLVTQD